LRKRWWETALL
jgi:PTBA: PTS system, glucose subfamily, IIA component